MKKRQLPNKLNVFRKQGYTIVEVIVALAILTIFFIVISSLEVTAIHSTRFIKCHQDASLVCDTVFSALRCEAISSEKEPKAKLSGTAKINGIEYKWVREISKAGDKPKMDNYMKNVKVTTTWAADTGSGKIERETFVVLVGVADPSPSPEPSPSY